MAPCIRFKTTRRFISLQDCMFLVTLPHQDKTTRLYMHYSDKSCKKYKRMPVWTCLEEMRHQLSSQGGGDVLGSSMVSVERSVSLKGSDNPVCLAWAAPLEKDSSSKCLSTQYVFALDWASHPSTLCFQTTEVVAGFNRRCRSLFVAHCLLRSVFC